MGRFRIRKWLPCESCQRLHEPKAIDPFGLYPINTDRLPQSPPPVASSCWCRVGACLLYNRSFALFQPPLLPSTTPPTTLAFAQLDSSTCPRYHLDEAGLVATSSFLATIRHIWPFAFLISSMAAALAASRKADEDDSWVSISHIGQRGRQQSRRTEGGSGARAGTGVGIEPLPYPKELKEWMYPAQ